MNDIENVNKSKDLSALKQSVLDRKVKKRRKQIKHIQAANKGVQRHRNPQWGEYHKLLEEVSRIILQYKNMADSVITGLQDFEEEYKVGVRPYLSTFLTDLSKFSAKVIRLKNSRMGYTGPVSSEDVMSFYEECIAIQDLTHDILAVMSPVQEQIVLHLARIHAKAQANLDAKTTQQPNEELILTQEDSDNDTAD